MNEIDTGYYIGSRLRIYSKSIIKFAFFILKNRIINSTRLQMESKNGH